MNGRTRITAVYGDRLYRRLQRARRGSMRVRPLIAAFLTVGAGTAVMSSQAADPVPTYQAVYEGFYRGRRVGETELSVTPIAGNGGAYEFRSVSRVRGLYRLLAPRPVEELSEFVYGNGGIQPLAYALSNGNRSGKDNFRVEFDWERGHAIITLQDQSVETELAPGVLDRGSLQVALMLRGSDLGVEQVGLVSRDGLEVHELRFAGEEVLETALGQFRTRKLIHQRLNSSRRTLLWQAPELHNLPVRIERQESGETRAGFRLKTVRWLDRQVGRAGTLRQ